MSWPDQTTLPTMQLVGIIGWLYRRTYYGVQVHPKQPVVWDNQPTTTTPARPAPDDARAAS